MAYKLKEALHRKILQAAIAGSLVAIERARQTGTPLIVWRDGKIKKLSPDSLVMQKKKTGRTKTKAVVKRKKQDC